MTGAQQADADASFLARIAALQRRIWATGVTWGFVAGLGGGMAVALRIWVVAGTAGFIIMLITVMTARETRAVRQVRRDVMARQAQRAAWKAEIARMTGQAGNEGAGRDGS